MSPPLPPLASRRSLVRRIGAGVALGLAGVAGGRLLLPDTRPELVRDLPGDPDARDRRFAARVASRFPSGTSEADARSALAAQGFTVHPDTRRAEWQGAAPPCRDFAQVQWDSAGGRITGARGVLWRACR